MNQKFDYLMEAFDSYLRQGCSGKVAWARAINDYAYVFHTDKHGTPLQRASVRALIDHGPEVDDE